MVEYRDIREMERTGRHAGVTYTVRVHADGTVPRYTLQEVAIDGRPVVKIGESFETLDQAFDMGHACAKAVIENKD
jgi:hypothetical protein